VPPPRAWPDKNPEADRRLKAARIAVADTSAELNIPIENVLTPDLLRRVSWAPPEPIELGAVREALAEMGAREWQLDAVAAPITAAFLDAENPDVVEPSEAVVELHQSAPTEQEPES
jgi:ribonuclease D